MYENSIIQTVAEDFSNSREQEPPISRKFLILFSHQNR